MTDDGPKLPFDPISPSADLKTIAAALISIEAWARRRGYHQIAGKVDAAVLEVERVLNESNKDQP